MPKLPTFPTLLTMAVSQAWDVDVICGDETILFPSVALVAANPDFQRLLVAVPAAGPRWQLDLMGHNPAAVKLMLEFIFASHDETDLEYEHCPENHDLNNDVLLLCRVYGLRGLEKIAKKWTRHNV